jgi:hypothetical protein
MQHRVLTPYRVLAKPIGPISEGFIDPSKWDWHVILRHRWEIYTLHCIISWSSQVSSTWQRKHEIVLLSYFVNFVLVNYWFNLLFAFLCAVCHSLLVCLYGSLLSPLFCWSLVDGCYCNVVHNSGVSFEDSRHLGCVPRRWVSRYRPSHSVKSVSA